MTQMASGFSEKSGPSAMLTGSRVSTFKLHILHMQSPEA